MIKYKTHFYVPGMPRSKYRAFKKDFDSREEIEQWITKQWFPRGILSVAWMDDAKKFKEFFCNVEGNKRISGWSDDIRDFKGYPYE